MYQFSAYAKIILRDPAKIICITKYFINISYILTILIIDFQDTITHLFTSNCGKYLIAADPQSNISIWKYEKKWEHYCKMPKYEEPLTAIAIQPETYNIVVSYSDHRVII